MKLTSRSRTPHLTSRKSHIKASSDLCEISNYASRASSFPEKFAKLIILFSAGTYPDVSLARARAGIKSGSGALRSLSTAGAAEQDWSRSWSGGLGGQADSGRGAEAAGVELAEDERLVTGSRTGRTQAGRRTVELAEDEWTQAVNVQRSRSTCIDLELCTHRHVLSNMHLGGR